MRMGRDFRSGRRGCSVRMGVSYNSKAVRGRTAVQNIPKRHGDVTKSKAARGRAAIQNISKRRETRRTPEGARKTVLRKWYQRYRYVRTAQRKLFERGNELGSTHLAEV